MPRPLSPLAETDRDANWVRLRVTQVLFSDNQLSPTQ